MIDWFILLRGMSLGVLVAMMLALALTFRHIYALRILAIFALCLCGYMLAPVLYGVNAGFYLAVALSEASTLMFLLLCQALFDEHQKPHRGTVVFGAVFLATSYTEIILRHALGFDTGWLFAAPAIVLLHKRVMRSRPCRNGHVLLADEVRSVPKSFQIGRAEAGLAIR